MPIQSISLKQNNVSPLGEPMVRTWRHTVCASYSPTAATVAKFTITGGPVLGHLLLGVIDTTLETTASNVSVVINPTTGTSDDLATTAEGSGAAAGDYFIVEGDGTAVVVAAGVRIFPLGAPVPFLVPTGTIDIVHAAAMTGTLHWELWWEPLSENATVVGN